MNAVSRRLFAAALIVIGIIATDAADGQDAPLGNGVFLVAKPELLDPNFRETVLLITQPQVGGGPVGVIVNRPLPVRLSKVLPGVGTVPEQFDHVYRGGPVARNELLFLLRASRRPERSLQVLADVFMSGDIRLLEQVVRREMTVTAFRAYAGYSGWAPGQLQAEIARGGWHVIQADADAIFESDPSAMWEKLIRRINTRSTKAVASNDILAFAHQASPGAARVVRH
jgi:putative transcriptional regulator